MDANAESDALGAARRQRRGVRAALVALESSTASPSVDDAWLATIRERLDELATAFADHVAVTESDDGLFAETVERAPRLARRVRVLHDDHVTITAAIEAARATAATATVADDPTDDDVATTIRAAVGDVMGRITRHRQLGADLVYEAYNVDIEGGD